MELIKNGSLRALRGLIGHLCHTWATIARNDCRINKDEVALCLGHEDADNKVTDIYIDYDYSIIDESNRKVLDKLK